MMKKTLAAGTIALTLAGAGFALAQQTPMQAPAGARGGFHMNAEDAAAFTDARIAALEAMLAKASVVQHRGRPGSSGSGRS